MSASDKLGALPAEVQAELAAAFAPDLRALGEANLADLPPCEREEELGEGASEIVVATVRYADQSADPRKHGDERVTWLRSSASWDRYYHLAGPRLAVVEHIQRALEADDLDTITFGRDNDQ